MNRCRSAPCERPATIRLGGASSRNYSVLASGSFVSVFMTLGFLTTSNFRGIDEALYSIIVPFECIGHLSVLGLCHVVSERGKIKLQAKLIFRVRFAALFCYLPYR